MKPTPLQILMGIAISPLLIALSLLLLAVVAFFAICCVPVICAFWLLDFFGENEPETLEK